IARMNAVGQKIAQRVFRQLVTPERTRAIVEFADLYALADNLDVTRVVDQLISARLLVSGGTTVELVHESLIESWPTLRRWLDEDQEDAAFLSQLAAAAKQWDARGRAAGLLCRGDAIEEARRWPTLRARGAATAGARRGRRGAREGRRRDRPQASRRHRGAEEPRGPGQPRRARRQERQARDRARRRDARARGRRSLVAYRAAGRRRGPQ